MLTPSPARLVSLSSHTSASGLGSGSVSGFEHEFGVDREFGGGARARRASMQESLRRTWSRASWDAHAHAHAGSHSHLHAGARQPGSVPVPVPDPATNTTTTTETDMGLDAELGFRPRPSPGAGAGSPEPRTLKRVGKRRLTLSLRSTSSVGSAASVGERGARGSMDSGSMQGLDVRMLPRI